MENTNNNTFYTDKARELVAVANQIKLLNSLIKQFEYMTIKKDEYALHSFVKEGGLTLLMNNLDNAIGKIQNVSDEIIVKTEGWE